jgi:hypothetical protein
MSRVNGYLAQLRNTPPLVFRFQFNPDSISEKRSYKWEGDNGFGKWDFSGHAAGTDPLSRTLGLFDDIKGAGPKLTNTKGLNGKAGGEPRRIALDFQLDASVPGPADGDLATRDEHYGGSIEPDLAILRSFVNPAWDPVQLTKMLLEKQFPCPGDPPECTFIYGGLSLACVMTDLDIKVVSFFETGAPLRAEVSVSLLEQTYSAGPAAETMLRALLVTRSFARKGIGADLVRTTPVVGSIRALFD